MQKIWNKFSVIEWNENGNFSIALYSIQIQCHYLNFTMDSKVIFFQRNFYSNTFMLSDIFSFKGRQHYYTSTCSLLITGWIHFISTMTISCLWKYVTFKLTHDERNVTTKINFVTVWYLSKVLFIHVASIH